MNIETFLMSVQTTVVSSECVAKIEARYSCSIPKEVQQIISFAQGGLFLDSVNFCRLLSFKEIFEAENELHVNFKAHGIIPLFDVEDNNFIVFDFANKIWKKFNIVDEVSYCKKFSLAEILN